MHVAPNSTHGNLTASVDPSLLLRNQDDIHPWMERQLAGKPDFIKLIAEAPGLPQESLNLLTARAHDSGKRVAMHASSSIAYSQAVYAGADHIQHVPLDQAINKRLLRVMRSKHCTSTPTLTMMRATAKLVPGADFNSSSLASVSLLHRSGIPILAGTDANSQAGVPASVPFGSSLHDELENLVEAGMSNLEALQAATLLPALHYGLQDRGAIRSGLRTDLVLVDGNPLHDIKASRNIRRVWVAGVEYPL